VLSSGSDTAALPLGKGVGRIRPSLQEEDEGHIVFHLYEQEDGDEVPGRKAKG
jgi:hypothetical protein